MSNDEKNSGILYNYISGNINENENTIFETENLNSEQDFSQLVSYASILAQSSVIDTNNAWSKVSKQLTPLKSTRVLKIRYIATAAAAAILAVVLTLMFKPQKVYKQYIANFPCENITLPDGSTICLNKGAVIEFQENFEGEQRLVKFSGEAYFDIKHNKTKPFVIQSGHNTIKVLGTEFNLVANDNDNIKVSVTDGCVSLINQVGNITVSKNEEAIAAQNSIPQKNKISKNVMLWQSKQLDFKDCPLQKAIEKLGYIYGVEIFIENANLNNLKLTSHYKNAKIEDIMHQISALLNINAEMSEVTGVWILQ